MSAVPAVRVRQANNAAANPQGDYILYWMVAFRRTQWNFSLQRAAELAKEFKKPLLIFEPLRCGYKWASDRLHHFVIQGMVDNAARCDGRSALYYPFLERHHGQGKGLLSALTKRACIVVSDDYPCFFLPRMLDSAADQVPVRFELVDSNGLLPMRAAEKVFARAVDFRRFLQQHLLEHLDHFPKADPLARLKLPISIQLPAEIARQWPPADVISLAARPEGLNEFSINHDVPITSTDGGTKAATQTLRQFLKTKLGRYDADRNSPDHDATSGLSPYLHFGHISAHQVFSETVAHDGWNPDHVSTKSKRGSRGWWGAGENVESFLDELITWRELGFNMCSKRDDYDQYTSLPVWAKTTLAEHANDPREFVYTLDEFEHANTHDNLWNAAQRQLVREGRIHNYLRMLWGKKILEWTESPQEALDIMIELNNKYGLDGRDPNSYSGIFWVLGRYDRAWGPERPIFGKVRYMSSENTARKLSVKSYLER